MDKAVIIIIRGNSPKTHITQQEIPLDCKKTGPDDPDWA